MAGFKVLDYIPSFEMRDGMIIQDGDAGCDYIVVRGKESGVAIIPRLNPDGTIYKNKIDTTTSDDLISCKLLIESLDELKGIFISERTMSGDFAAKVVDKVIKEYVEKPNTHKEVDFA